MRFFLGIIVGVLLTIGGAYVYDSATTGTDTSSIDRPVIEMQRPMVNWDIVNRNWRQLTNRVRQEWHKLAAT
jgi:hypothetical protein